MKDEGTVLFATQSYRYLQAAMLDLGNFIEGTVEVELFPDGERYQRLLTSVRNRSVVILAGTISDSDTLELYDLACAIVKYGANRLTIITPYFGYSTMERAKKPGEVVTAKTRARLLSSIPEAPLGNKIVGIDLHGDGLPHYFEGPACAVHLYSKPVLLPAIRSVGGDNFVLAAADAGRAKWVQSLANDLGVESAFVLKRRSTGTDTQVLAVSAHVHGRIVVIYDDMIRTGGSLIGAGHAYKSVGAEQIWIVTTHGVFCGGAVDRLKSSGLFRGIVCTDSHPAALAARGDFVRVESIAPLLVDYLRDEYDVG